MRLGVERDREDSVTKQALWRASIKLSRGCCFYAGQAAAAEHAAGCMIILLAKYAPVAKRIGCSRGILSRNAEIRHLAFFL